MMMIVLLAGMSYPLVFVSNQVHFFSYSTSTSYYNTLHCIAFFIVSFSLVHLQTPPPPQPIPIPHQKKPILLPQELFSTTITKKKRKNSSTQTDNTRWTEREEHTEDMCTAVPPQRYVNYHHRLKCVASSLGSLFFWNSLSPCSWCDDGIYIFLLCKALPIYCHVCVV